MLYAAKSLMRVGLPTRLKRQSDKQGFVFFKKPVSFACDLFEQYCFYIENLCFFIWAKSTIQNRTFGPFFFVSKAAQYL